MNWHKRKIGILGGGQLGKMLCEAASPMGINLHIMDKDASFPAASVCTQFYTGDFTNYANVMAFGNEMDIVSIEIENVNTQALKDLEAKGKKVYPQAHLIEMIKDKGLQKLFYLDNGFSTTGFHLFDTKQEIIEFLKNRDDIFPIFQKARTEGYDGRGVQQIKGLQDFDKIWDVPSVLESAVDLDKEIAIIVARDAKGESACYPAVEMHFHPTANLLDYQLCPANISTNILNTAKQLALRLANELEIVGLLAVEMFIDTNGHCLINEVAPRPHNSGHHTIEAHTTSQYEQLVRILSGLPLGSPEMKLPSLLLNILGEEAYTGMANYVGVEKCLALPGVHLHLYGKKQTKPFRKMGHVCIVAENLESAMERANFVKEHLKVISQP